MPPKPSTPPRRSAPLPSASGSIPRRPKCGWVELPICKRRCWFPWIPRSSEEFRNYIDVVDAFGQRTHRRFGHILCWSGDHLTTIESSTSCGPMDPEPHITVLYSEDLTVDYPRAQSVHIYYNGEPPRVVYRSHSGPRPSYWKVKMGKVIAEAGDQPLKIPPESPTAQPQLMRRTTQSQPTTPSNPTIQLHSPTQSTHTAQTSGGPISNRALTYAQVVAKNIPRSQNRR